MTPINYNTFFELLCEDERNRTPGQTAFTRYETRHLSYGRPKFIGSLPDVHKTCTRKPS